MDAERIRAYLLTLPHAVESMQWGATLVFWTCDKSIGGKMFAILNFNEPSPGAPSRLRLGGGFPRRNASVRWGNTSLLRATLRLPPRDGWLRDSGAIAVCGALRG